MKLSDISDEVARLADTNGWLAEGSSKPQTARNLVVSLVLEAAELLECYQWSETGDSTRVADELADIIIFAAQISNVTGIDLEKAVSDKLQRNQARNWPK